MQKTFTNKSRSVTWLINLAYAVPVSPSGLRGSCMHPVPFQHNSYMDLVNWRKNHNITTYLTLFSLVSVSPLHAHCQFPTKRNMREAREHDIVVGNLQNAP